MGNDGTTHHLEISADTAYVNLNDSVWLGKGEGSWHLEISDNTAFVQLGSGSEIFLGNGTGGWHLEIDAAGFIQIGDGVLSKDDLDLGASGTIEAGTSIEVGATVITPYNIDLGTGGTITVGSRDYTETQIQDCNGKKLWILADTAGWQ